MRILITTEYRFQLANDGSVLANPSRAYRFWARYLDIFDSVLVLGRLGYENVKGAQPVEGPGVAVAPLPEFIGPAQYVLKARKLRRAIGQTNIKNSALILRVPSKIGNLFFFKLKRLDYPYGLEVVGDPYDVFAPGAVRHPLRPFFRYWFSRQLRHQCARASAVAYVTERALQRRYPPAPSAFSTHYSDVELGDDTFAAAPHNSFAPPSPITLITVGSLAQLYKASDVLIDAVAACVQSGLDLKLVIVGDGKHRPELEARAGMLRLGERVIFMGQLPAGKAIRDVLDQADLFILPSRTEGLPRAMIEAMARGLPCIGSTVGGIPELLPAEDMVPPGDAEALAIKIRDVVTNPERMAQMSAHNLDKAKEYREDVLRARRTEFYMRVKELTQEWLTTQ